MPPPQYSYSGIEPNHQPLNAVTHGEKNVQGPYHEISKNSTNLYWFVHIRKELILPEEATWWSVAHKYAVQKVLSLIALQFFPSLLTFLNNTWMWTAVKWCCQTCSCYCFTKMKWPSVTAGAPWTENRNLKRLDIWQILVIWCHVHLVTWGELIQWLAMTVSSALNIRWCEALRLFMFIFRIGSANCCFVFGIINQHWREKKQTFCLSDTFVTFCIVSLKALVLGFFFSFVSRELNMIVMCHNVIVLI